MGADSLTLEFRGKSAQKLRYSSNKLVRGLALLPILVYFYPMRREIMKILRANDFRAKLASILNF